MSSYISKQDGNFSAVGTWNNIALGTGASMFTRTAVTTTTTSYVWSSAFTVTTGQVIDGVMIYLYKNNSTGTLSVALSADNGVTATREVVIDVADLMSGNIEQSWVFFKFGSTLTADGGADYKVGIKSSTAGSVNPYRDSTAGNWVRALRLTSSPAALAAADDFYPIGEMTGQGTSNTRTITMDLTSAAITAYGSLHVSYKSYFTWGTSASTNYYIKLGGDYYVYAGATSTNDATPRNSTSVIETNPTSDGQYGVLALNGSTFTFKGLSRTSGKDIVKCHLNADETATSTSLAVDADTGFLSGDVIAIAPTRRLVTQWETRTLNGNATATDIAITAGLTNDHDGTGNLKADVILLTRNAKIRSASSSFMTYFYAAPTAVVDIDWVEFRYIGTTTTNKRGIDVQTTTGSCSITHCSVYDSENHGIYCNGSSIGNITLTNDVFCNLGIAYSGSYGIYIFSTSGSNIVVNDNTVIGMSSQSSAMGFYILDKSIEFQRNSASGCWGYGAIIGEMVSASSGTFTNFLGYCNTLGGLQALNCSNIDFVDFSIIRNITTGVYVSNCIDCNFNNLTILGTTSEAFSINGNFFGCNFDNLIIQAESSYATSYAFAISSPTIDVYMNNSDISGNVACGFDIILRNTNLFVKMYLNNTYLRGTETWNTAYLYPTDKAFISSMKHGGANAVHKIWMANGILEYTTSVPTGWTSPCMKMTPGFSSIKLESAPTSRGIKACVDSGQTITASVKLQKSASYNGNQPRLIVRKNVAAGITEDTVLDTMTVGTATDETLSGTTSAVSDDAALEFIVDVDGTAGVVYVDDITFS